MSLSDNQSAIDTNTYERIYSSALKLLYSNLPAKTYETIVNEAVKLVKAKHGSLFLVRDGKIIRVFATHPELYKVIPRKNGNTRKVYFDQKPYLLRITEVNKSHPELNKFQIGYDLSIPLAFNDKTFGVLSVLSHDTSTFTKNDLLILQLFSQLASLALRNTQLFTSVTETLKEQDMFISMAAHELKTPLTTISAYAQILLKSGETTETSTLIMLQKMFQEIQRLSKLVNELLQVSQIKKGRLEYVMKKCDVLSIIHQAVSNFQSANSMHILQFTCKEAAPLYIKGDADRITQMINNLITNAVKFSSKGSKITINLIKEAEHLRISVRDQGKGIADKDIDKIFEGFYKGESRNKEGLGLGLFLVKNIVTYHKGSIKVQSKLKKGTTFTIYLPLYAKN